jgi:hypothetical protein
VMAKQKLNVDVDGVISVDPIAMASLLAAFGKGGVAVDGTQLTATNVVSELLNNVYIKNNPGACGSDNTCIQRKLADQDDFFKHAAKSIFNAVMAGQGDQQTTIRGLGASTSQHRIQLWSNHPDEQAKLAGTAISGGLAGNTGSTPQVGMYLNDSTASKMDYYLEYRSSVSAIACRQKGGQDLRATVALKSNMPKDFRGLGNSVLGNGDFAKQGDISVNMRIYAPYGGEVTELTVDGAPVSISSDKQFGRPVAFLPITLKPGEESLVVAEIRTKNGQDGDGVFSFTPGMVFADTSGDSIKNGSKIPSACN